MKHWIFCFVFVFSLLVVAKYLLIFLLELFSSNPNRVKLTINEQIILGVALSYAATYLTN